MTFNKDPSLTPHAAPPPAPTTGGTTSPKLSPPSDVCSTAPYHVYVNTPIEPTEAFKNTVKDIIEAISYITASMSYEPETVLLNWRNSGRNSSLLPPPTNFPCPIQTNNFSVHLMLQSRSSTGTLRTTRIFFPHQ